MNLDEAIRKFKGYILEENGFDELDFKEVIEAIMVKERIDENALNLKLCDGKPYTSEWLKDFFSLRDRRLKRNLQELTSLKSKFEDKDGDE